jgi:CRP-like cAMP-binding protein
VPGYTGRVAAKEYPLSRVERAGLDLKLLQKSCANCGLYQLCLPASIGGEDLPRLEQVVQVKKTLEREQALYTAGQPFRALYVVRSGAFKTYAVDGEGETQVLGFHLPGEIMGLDAIAGGRHQCSAEALAPSSACEVPYDRLEQVARELPGLQQQLLRVISREVQQGPAPSRDDRAQNRARAARDLPALALAAAAARAPRPAQLRAADVAPRPRELPRPRDRDG